MSHFQTLLLCLLLRPAFGDYPLREKIQVDVNKRETVRVNTAEDISDDGFNWVVSMKITNVESDCIESLENITELGIFFPAYFKSSKLPQVHSWLPDFKDGDDNFINNGSFVRTRLLDQETFTMVAKNPSLDIILTSLSDNTQTVNIEVNITND